MGEEHATTEEDMGLASSQGLHALQDSLVNGAGSKGLDQTVIVDTHLLSINHSSLDVPRVNCKTFEQRKQ